MSHISGMMCLNVEGIPLPPLIILSKLKNLPDELKRLVEFQQIYVSSTPSGFMNRDCFLLLTFHFIHFLTEYQAKIKDPAINENALQILDGHFGRENPLALALLKRANVTVLILPSHTSLVLQMFDCVIASPLKRDFSEISKNCMRELSLYFKFKSIFSIS